MKRAIERSLFFCAVSPTGEAPSTALSVSQLSPLSLSPPPSPPRPLNEPVDSLCLTLPSPCCHPAAPAPPLSARDLSQQLPPGKEEDPVGWERCPGEKGLGGTKDPVNYSETQAGQFLKRGGAVPPRAGVAPLFWTQAAPSPARPRWLERQEHGSADHPWSGSEPPRTNTALPWRTNTALPWRLQRGSPLINASFPATLPLLSPFCIL